MPLFKPKSAKKESMESESPPMKGNLAIAYDIQRRSKRKKMAKGGEVTANSEKRADADDATDMRDLVMDKHKPSMKQELNAHEDHMGDQSDLSDRDLHMIERGKKMAMMARGGELNAHEDAMDGIDDQDMGRDLMMDRKRPSMMQERDANDDMETDIDDASDMRNQSMLKRKSKSESYAKDGVVKYAEGGDVSVADAIRRKRKDEDDMADVGSNADEGTNYENKLNYRAAREQVYPEDETLDEMDYPASNLHGQDMEDENDMDLVDLIRRKMKGRK
jgi:hypothetical protein